MEICGEAADSRQPVALRKLGVLEDRGDFRLLGPNARHEVLDQARRLLGREPVEPAFADRENRQNLLPDSPR